MKNLRQFIAVTIIAFVFAAMVSVTTTAHAHEVKAGNLIFVHPFARASAGPAKVGAAFMGVHNHGDSADHLIAVRIDESIAKKAELHAHTMEGDIAKMRKVEGGIEVPAHGMIMMQPGGLHIMIMKLKAPLEEGGNFMLTLVFEHAGEIMIDVPIMGVGAGMEHVGMEHGDKNLNHGDMNHNSMDMD